jgi:hypothetical protein
MAIEHMVKAMPVTAVIQTPKAKITADKVDSPTVTTTEATYSRQLFKSAGLEDCAFLVR